MSMKSLDLKKRTSLLLQCLCSSATIVENSLDLCSAVSYARCWDHLRPRFQTRWASIDFFFFLPIFLRWSCALRCSLELIVSQTQTVFSTLIKVSTSRMHAKTKDCRPGYRDSVTLFICLLSFNFVQTHAVACSILRFEIFWEWTVLKMKWHSKRRYSSDWWRWVIYVLRGCWQNLWLFIMRKG